MKTYKMSDKEIQKKRITYGLGFGILVAFLLFMVADPLLILANDPMPQSFKVFIIALLIFASIRVINFLNTLSKIYFEIDGTTLTYHCNKKVKQHDLINDYIVIKQTDTTALYSITVATSVALEIRSKNGTKGSYAPIILGKDAFYEMLDDINSIRASHQEEKEQVQQ